MESDYENECTHVPILMKGSESVLSFCIRLLGTFSRRRSAAASFFYTLGRIIFMEGS